MSKERELLQEALEWMHELNYVWADSRNSGDRLSLELIADINKIEQLLAQPEHVEDKLAMVDFQTLNEMGLRRLQVSDELVLQEGCSISPTLIISAENGNVIEVIGYKKLLEIRRFIDGILNYEYTPSKREPLMTDSDIRTHTPFHYHDAEKKAFALGVRWAEVQHGITGVDDDNA